MGWTARLPCAAVARRRAERGEMAVSLLLVLWSSLAPREKELFASASWRGEVVNRAVVGRGDPAEPRAAGADL